MHKITAQKITRRNKSSGRRKVYHRQRKSGSRYIRHRIWRWSTGNHLQGNQPKQSAVSFEKQEDGNYKITAVHSKKALTMESDGRIVQSRWKNANNQKWKVIRDLQGNYYIQNVESSKGISLQTEAYKEQYIIRVLPNNCSWKTR